VSGVMSKLERLGRMSMRLVSPVAWGALLPAPICGDPQSTPPTAGRQERVSYQKVNRACRVDALVNPVLL
jgi:hypothetical protein